MSVIKRYPTLAFIIASTLLFYFIFSPAINILHYFGDDYRYAFGGFFKSCSGDDGYYFMRTIGRPMQAYLDCLNYKFAFTLERMKMLRGLSVVLLGWAVGLFAAWLYRLGLSIWSAFFVSGCLFLVQHLYPDTLAYGATSLPFAILLAIYSYWELDKIHAPWLQHKIHLGWAGVLLLVSMLTYPAMAFFFCTMILTKVLFSPLQNWAKVRSAVMNEMVFFLVVGAIYFAWGYYNMHYHARAPIPESYRLSHPNLNPVEIMKRILLLMNVFDSRWQISPRMSSLWQGWFIAVCIVGGLSCGSLHFFKSDFYRQNKWQALTTLLQIVASASAVFVLGSAFFLVMPNLSLVENRVLFGVITSGLLLAVWGVMQWSYLLPEKMRTGFLVVVVGGCFLIQGRQANIVTLINALSHQQYMQETHAVIAVHINQGGPLQRIHFIIPRSNYPYDRFFMANTALLQLYGQDHYKIAWCSLARGVPGEEKDRQNETIACVNAQPKNTVAVTYSYDAEPFRKTPAMAIVKNHYQEIDPTS
ncbi:MAG: hypothetical protein A3E83_01710 [Gammaproteobacteria bacterium RIFCSPHIGHO2_12_FULL_41_20]|nr:MAG: hypothetical protein A3E83_01710 [Gammaproteobacteria bacterium RIFCSPHIGHO2_12_FULL_41_20]